MVVARRLTQVTVRLMPAAVEAVWALVERLGARPWVDCDCAAQPCLAFVCPGDGRAEVAAVRDLLCRLPGLGIDPGPADIHCQSADPSTWRTAWRAHLCPVRVAGFLVSPPWLDPESNAGEQPLVIDPGPAFGYPDHPTTRLCLCLLCRAAPQGLTVLDCGTGSGILAVAAARLGARRVWAIDTDPLAVAAARDNAAANGVAVRVQVRCLSLEAAAATAPATTTTDTAASPTATATTATTATTALPPCDLVLANLAPALTADGLRRVARLLRPGGRTVLSGAAASRAAEVEGLARAAGLNPVESSVRSGWWAALFDHRPAEGAPSEGAPPKDTPGAGIGAQPEKL